MQDAFIVFDTVLGAFFVKLVDDVRVANYREVKQCGGVGLRHSTPRLLCCHGGECACTQTPKGTSIDLHYDLP
jgi:hypothetical protein